MKGLKRSLGCLLFALAPASAQVDQAALLDAQRDDESWLMYGRNYAAWRYSPLDQIDAANVHRLAPAWIFQSGVSGKFQTTPLVREGVMYVTGPSNHAWALDLKTGRQLWHYSEPVPEDWTGCCGRPNRGFAMQGELLYKVNVQATLVALDATTGEVVWETEVADYRQGYSNTVAPLIVKDMVVVGIAGAEFGTRDFIDAYDGRTGHRRWRFWTVPGPGEPGNETWGGDSWQRGGASTWITGSYDPDLDLIYWGTGNPGPDLDGSPRPGDNLYSDSMLALDADSGALSWHFQFTPHDVHDWDAVADPVLVDAEVDGQSRRILLQANRNGHLYALDRTSGEFLFARAYTEVNWADGIDSRGRPILIPGHKPTDAGTLTCPGMGGGHNWHATTYSPLTGLYYFNSGDGCQIYHKSTQEFVEGEFYLGSAMENVSGSPREGSILAVEPGTGRTRWRFPLVSPPSSGLLSTGGGLLFAGTREGYFFALDARRGEVLWRLQTGGPVQAPAIAYRFQGRQYVATAAGSALFAFALPREGEGR